MAVRSFPPLFGRVQLSFGLLWKLFSERGRFDVVIIHGAYKMQSSLAAGICSAFGLPFVVQPHGSIEPYHRRRHRVRKAAYERLFLRDVLRRSAFVACASEGERHNVSLAFPSSRPVTVGLGISDETVSDRPRTGPLRRIGFVGRFSEKKGLPILAEAFVEVLSDSRFAGRGLHLVLAGDHENSVGAEVTRILIGGGARQATDFLGHLSGEELRKFYDELDLFCLPSYNENFAVAVAEACARGVPVIVSESVALAPLVLEFGSGRVLSENSPRALAFVIAELLLSEATSGELSSGAIQMARHLAWSRVGAQWLRALECAICAGPGPADSLSS